MVRIFARYLACFLLLSSCGPGAGSVIDDTLSFQLFSAYGEKVDLRELKEHKATAFFFLSPDCPLSQKYSRSIRSLFSEYSAGEVNFYLVFSGKMYDQEEVKTFLADFDLPFVSIIDIDKKLTDRLQATITPEVVLVDGGGIILYRGAIDNWYVAVGQQRQVITGHYLQDALSAFLSGRSIANPETQAVGCIIE